MNRKILLCCGSLAVAAARCSWVPRSAVHTPLISWSCGCLAVVGALAGRRCALGRLIPDHFQQSTGDPEHGRDARGATLGALFALTLAWIRVVVFRDAFAAFVGALGTSLRRGRSQSGRARMSDVLWPASREPAASAIATASIRRGHARAIRRLALVLGQLPQSCTAES